MLAHVLAGDLRGLEGVLWGLVLDPDPVSQPAIHGRHPLGMPHPFGRVSDAVVAHGGRRIGVKSLRFAGEASRQPDRRENDAQRDPQGQDERGQAAPLDDPIEFHQ